MAARLGLAVFAWVLFLLGGGIASATPGYTLTTAADDPLVKQLEARLASLGRAAARGDVAAARAMRTAAANKRVPITSAVELKRLGRAIAPNRSDYAFVQLESSATRARLVWSRTVPDELTILVQMFAKEGGEWKVDGNHGETFIGAVPKLPVAVAQALKRPGVALP